VVVVLTATERSGEGRPSWGRDEGAVAIVVATMAVVLFALAAFVVDLGLARDNRRQAQNTADAAALAAANALYAQTAPNLMEPGDFKAAVDAAKDYAALNYGTKQSDWAQCSIPSTEALDYVWPGTGTNCISFDRTPYPHNVLVVVPLRDVPSLFGAVLGYKGMSISALAQARIAPGGRPVCTFCVVKESTHNLQNGELNVVGGNMWFNGTVNIEANGSAGSAPGSVLGEDGQYYTDGGEVYVQGEITGSTANIQGGLAKPRSPKILDPMASVVLPFATQSTLQPKVDPCTDGPGIYDKVKVVSEVCTFQPGLYVFTGDLELAGNASTQVNAVGVTMYFTCGSSSEPERCRESGLPDGAGLRITGQGTYTLAAPFAATHPQVPAELYGFGVVYDRYNDAAIFLSGNGTQNLTGTIYAMNATMDVRGNGCSTVTTSMVVVGSVNFAGTNPCFTAVFDSTKNVRPGEGGRGLAR
jgi:hypothetical protein